MGDIQKRADRWGKYWGDILKANERNSVALLDDMAEDELSQLSRWLKRWLSDVESHERQATEGSGK